MKTQKLLIDFRSGTNAYERNMHIKLELEKMGFVEVVKGILILPNGSYSDKIYEDQEIEEANSIEIHYTCT